jgi:hypothetical protein
VFGGGGHGCELFSKETWISGLKGKEDVGDEMRDFLSIEGKRYKYKASQRNNIKREERRKERRRGQGKKIKLVISL